MNNKNLEVLSAANDINNYDVIKERLFCRVVNKTYKRNKELLEKSLSEPLTEELEVIYSVLLSGDEEGNFLTNVPKCTEINDISALKEKAVKNQKANISPMAEILMGFGHKLPEDEEVHVTDIGLNVLYTKILDQFGAGALADKELLRKTYEKIGQFYILPSSIHEIIVVSAKAGEPNEMLNMVKEINATKVADDDKLADDVYTYDPKTDKIISYTYNEEAFMELIS